MELNPVQRALPLTSINSPFNFLEILKNLLKTPRIEKRKKSKSISKQNSQNLPRRAQKSKNDFNEKENNIITFGKRNDAEFTPPKNSFCRVSPPNPKENLQGIKKIEEKNTFSASRHWEASPSSFKIWEETQTPKKIILSSSKRKETRAVTPRVLKRSLSKQKFEERSEETGYFFRPLLCKKSLEMASRFESPTERLTRPSQNCQAASPFGQDFKFLPEINNRSRMIASRSPSSEFSTFDRLYNMDLIYKENRARRKLINEKYEDRLERENCTFKPILNRRPSPSLKKEKMEQRNRAWEQARLEKIKKQREKQEADRNRSCCFQPKVERSHSTNEMDQKFVNRKFFKEGLGEFFKNSERVAQLRSKRQRDNGIPTIL